MRTLLKIVLQVQAGRLTGDVGILGSEGHGVSGMCARVRQLRKVAAVHGHAPPAPSFRRGVVWLQPDAAG